MSFNLDSCDDLGVERIFHWKRLHERNEAFGRLNGGVRLGWAERRKEDFSGKKKLCANISVLEQLGVALILLCMWQRWGAWADWLRIVITPGVLVVAQWKWTQLVSTRMRVQSLAPLSGLRTRCYHELLHRSQMQLRSYIAVSVV